MFIARKYCNSNSVNVIKNQVFQECTSLKAVKIGDGLEEIDDAMFANCTLLEEIYLGRKIKSVGDAAFNNCPSIKDVYFKGSKEQWNTLNIEDNNEQLKNATIHYNS